MFYLKYKLIMYVCTCILFFSNCNHIFYILVFIVVYFFLKSHVMELVYYENQNSTIYSLLRVIVFGTIKVAKCIKHV